MALSDKKILEEMEAGNIIIDPFDRANLSTSSYDVTLGDFYFSEQDTGNTVYNPFSKNDVDRVWGVKPRRAKTAKEVFADTSFAFDGIAEDDRAVLIEPGETILAHTNEFIGGRNHITSMMKARSSWGRNFIEVCKCAGWGDVGYTNRWAMEITNNSRRHGIPIVVGRRIAQIIFIETGEILGDDYTRTGKYQGADDSVEAIKRGWDPTSILPKMYHDREAGHTG